MNFELVTLSCIGVSLQTGANSVKLYSYNYEIITVLPKHCLQCSVLQKTEWAVGVE